MPHAAAYDRAALEGGRPMARYPMATCLDGRHPPFNLEATPDGCPLCARVVRVEDMGPIELAYAEAMHEDCSELPPGHPLADHSPWSGSDLDGVETWEAFTDRLARHGLELKLTT